MSDLPKNKLQLRCVVFHTKLGVYLGDDEWSYGYKGPKPYAPTYEQDNHTATHVIQSNQGAELRQCHADVDDVFASQDAIANALLPRWK